MPLLVESYEANVHVKNAPTGMTSWFVVDKDPTGTVARPAGTVAFLRDGSAAWISTDGLATGWVKVVDLAMLLSTTGTGAIVRQNNPTMTGIRLTDGAVGTPSLTWSTDTTCGLYHTGTAGTGAILFGVNGVEVLKLNATGMQVDGNVGIGTASPNARLDIRPSGESVIAVNASLAVEESSSYSQGIALSLYRAGTFNEGRPSAFIGTACTPTQIIVSGGARVTDNVDAPTWATPVGTAAQFLRLNDGMLRFYGDTSLTIGVAYTPTELLRITADGNVLIGTTAAGASAAKTLVLSNAAVAPTASADACHLYCHDHNGVAGRAAFAIRAEAAMVASGDRYSTHEILATYNGTPVWILCRNAA